MLARRLRRVLVRTERLPDIEVRHEVVSTVLYGDIAEVTYVIEEESAAAARPEPSPGPAAPPRRPPGKPGPQS